MVVLIPPSEDVIREHILAILTDLESDNSSFNYSGLSHTGDCQQQLEELIEARKKSLTWYKNTLASYKQSTKYQQSPLVLFLKSLDLPDFLTTGKQGKPVYKLLSMDDIENLPDVEYQIGGILQQETVTLLFGDSNVGKTFVALDIASHIAYGMAWLGRAITQGRVLYIYGEGIRGLKSRIQAWRKHHDIITRPDLRFIPRPVLLNDTDEKQWLLDTITDQDTPPTLIVIDTFSNCAPGINQNDQAEVYRILAVAHEIVRTHHCNVLITHHSNKQGQHNGTAAFRNHVDTMIELKEDDGIITMHCDKQRDGERFPDIALQLQTINLYADPITGDTITSCVVVPTETLEQKTPPDAQIKVLELLQVHGQLNCSQWAKQCQEIYQMSQASFYRIQRVLVNQEYITPLGEKKNGSRLFYALTESGKEIIAKPLSPLSNHSHESGDSDPKPLSPLSHPFRGDSGDSGFGSQGTE